MQNPTQDTLQRIAEAQKAPIADADLTRAFGQSATATSGLTFYDLEAPAKLLYPVLTPLRNKIPRIVGGKGIQANWRAITGINTTQMRPGVSEGRRGGAIEHTTADYFAKFAGLGLEDYVTFEADYAAQGFDDVKARAVEGLLRATMIQEEFIDLGGLGTFGINAGSACTVTATGATDGGSLSGTGQGGKDYSVVCVPLNLQGYQQVAGVANGTVNDAAAIASVALQPTFSRVSMDGLGTETVAGGLGRKGSATANIASGSTGSIAASVAPVSGAVAYAWYWGLAAGDVKLGAITTINSVSITATATGTQLASAIPDADHSQDSLVYDGILSQVMKSGSGAYVCDLATGTAGAGTKLSSDAAGGVSQIEAAFQAFWNEYRLSPDVIYCNAQQLLDISTIVIKNGGAPLLRYPMDGGKDFTAGTVVTNYLNKITQKQVKIEVHPNMPPGTILFWSDSIPYPLSNVGTLVAKKLRRDYYQIEWPLRTRRYEYGVYCDGVLQNYFPPAFGIIRNIAAGV